MTVLVTGAAGFIGYHVARTLLNRGERVLGIDNLNDYYSVSLKRARLSQLDGQDGFTFVQADISDLASVTSAVNSAKVDRVIHLAAQAGVRYSLNHPFAYLRANLTGHLVILEVCRYLPDFRHLVYASSSSVYGGNTKVPFSEQDRVDHPVSLYAATKKADELMSHTYAHLYAIPQTGLRFFTVYGPWGRPDMAMWLFTEAILNRQPIRVFNYGDMERDFTYIDDIVAGVIAALDHPPSSKDDSPPHRIYNIGNNKPERLAYLIELIEKLLGVEAEQILMPMQPGDVKKTFADIRAIRQDLGFTPTTSLETGVPKFIEWFREYHCE